MYPLSGDLGAWQSEDNDCLESECLKLHVQAHNLKPLQATH